MIFTPGTLKFFQTQPFQGNYLEIGVYAGESIATMAKTFPKKLIIGIDPFIEDGNTSHHSGVQQGKVLQTQKDLTLKEIKNLTNIILYEETSENFYDRLTDERIEKLDIGAAFIDGSHWYKDVVIDFKLVMKLFNGKRGIICVDDLHIPDVKKALDEFIGSLGNKLDQVLYNKIPNQAIIFVR